MNERITPRDVAAYKREVLEQSVLVTPSVAGDILSCSERTVHNLVRDGDLHGYARNKGRRGLRILAKELQEYVGSIKIDRERWLE